MRSFLTTTVLLLVVLFTGCKKDDHLAVVGVCPLVVSTIPADKAVNIPLNQVVSATFNELMNTATITTSSFTLTGTTAIAGVKAATVVTGAITFSGTTVTTAIFTPTSLLTPNTTYTGKIATSVKDLTGNALQVEHVWTFTTGVSPTVISTDPVNTATNVLLTKVVNATFSVPMDPLTINATTVTLSSGTTPVPVVGTVTYTGSTVSFTPSTALAAGTVYTGTITTGAKNLIGTPLATNFVWTFNTGVSPTVLSTDPANNAVGVILNKVVAATFSVAMDPLTLTATTFTLKQGATVIAGAVTYTGTTASFTPAVALLPGTIYTGTITTGAKNVAGMPLISNYVWTFTTGVSPTVLSTDPANLATGVALNKVVAATFSVAMDPLTINGTNFTLKQGATAIAGAVTYTGTTASFTPTVALLPNTVYTGTVTTGAKNVGGIPLASNYVWTFTTVAAVAPTVLSTDPANNAVGVVLNKVVAATFSVAMDPLTLSSPATNFTLKQGLTAIAGAVTYSGTTASFTPTVALLPNTVYTGTITTGAKNVAGTALASSYVWTFTTVAVVSPTVISTDPLNLAIGVAVDKVVAATFSVPMDPLTISSTTYTLKQGATSVAGLVTYSGSTASFNPTVNLLANTTYTATVTTGAKNVAGTPLAADYSWSFTTELTPFLPLVDLKTAGRFGILAYTTVTNNAGASVINNMDVGISPGARSSVTGFPPATIVNGAIYCADDIAPPGTPAMLTQAKLDLTAAYLFAEGATAPAPATVAGDQGGKTLAPGIYKSTSTLLVQSGDLTLDGGGDPNATWIFQIASDFTTVGGAGGNIILSNGAKAKNITWQVGRSAVIGDNTIFYGNVLALTSITMNAYATATGRMLAQNGAVVMTSTNIINKP